MEIRLRTATEDDKPAIAALHALSWQDGYAGILPDTYLAKQVFEDLSDQWRDTEIQDGDVILLAERVDGPQQNTMLVGFIAVWCRPDPYIDNLHIHPEFQSRQLGQRLMATAVQALNEHGHGTAYLWVFSDNTRAIRFYERLGGEITETATMTFFGNDVPSSKVVWTDLSRFEMSSAGQDGAVES